MNTAFNPPSAVAFEAMEARFARGIAAHLSLSAAGVAPDIGERLRFARERALQAAFRARRSSHSEELSGAAQGVAILGFSHSPLWRPLAAAVPVLALVAGLVFIQAVQTRSQIDVAAEVDAALLGDDLPISAYRDAGFVEFLKSPPSQ